MIRYKCAKCKATLESPESRIGQDDTCPMCGHVGAVPATVKSKTPMILGLVIAGAGVVIAAAIGIPLLLYPEPAPLTEPGAPVAAAPGKGDVPDAPELTPYQPDETGLPPLPKLPGTTPGPAQPPGTEPGTGGPTTSGPITGGPTTPPPGTGTPTTPTTRPPAAGGTRPTVNRPVLGPTVRIQVANSSSHPLDIFLAGRDGMANFHAYLVPWGKALLVINPGDYTATYSIPVPGIPDVWGTRRELIRIRGSEQWRFAFRRVPTEPAWSRHVAGGEKTDQQRADVAEFEKRTAVANLADDAVVAELATWADEHDLPEQRRAFLVSVGTQRFGLPDSGADGLRKLAAWLKDRTLHADADDCLMSAARAEYPGKLSAAGVDVNALRALVTWCREQKLVQERADLQVRILREFEYPPRRKSAGENVRALEKLIDWCRQAHLQAEVEDCTLAAWAAEGKGRRAKAGANAMELAKLWVWCQWHAQKALGDEAAAKALEIAPDNHEVRTLLGYERRTDGEPGWLGPTAWRVTLRAARPRASYAERLIAPRLDTVRTSGQPTRVQTETVHIAPTTPDETVMYVEVEAQPVLPNPDAMALVVEAGRLIQRDAWDMPAKQKAQLERILPAHLLPAAPFVGWRITPASLFDSNKVVLRLSDGREIRPAYTVKPVGKGWTQGKMTAYRELGHNPLKPPSRDLPEFVRAPGRTVLLMHPAARLRLTLIYVMPASVDKATLDFHGATISFAFAKSKKIKKR